MLLIEQLMEIPFISEAELIQMQFHMVFLEKTVKEI